MDSVVPCGVAGAGPEGGPSGGTADGSYQTGWETREGRSSTPLPRWKPLSINCCHSLTPPYHLSSPEYFSAECGDCWAFLGTAPSQDSCLPNDKARGLYHLLPVCKSLWLVCVCQDIPAALPGDSPGERGCQGTRICQGYTSVLDGGISWNQLGSQGTLRSPHCDGLYQ